MLFKYNLDTNQLKLIYFSIKHSFHEHTLVSQDGFLYRNAALITFV